MTQIETALDRIKAWFSANAPEAMSLNPPATVSELQELRLLLGPDTPAELLELHAIHNGAADYGFFADGMQFMSIAQVAYDHRWDVERGGFVSEPRQGSVRIGAVKSVFFPPKRVPFAAWNGKVRWSIDCDPAPGGIAGQIVYEDIESDHLEVIATTLYELLSHYANDLERDVFSLSEEGYIESKCMFWPNCACGH